MRKLSSLIAIMIALLLLISCNAGSDEPASDDSASDAPAASESTAEEKTMENLVVGYAQIGAESEWRTANTASIKETAEQLGVDLKFSDAQQKQENQIAAIRSYIAEGVDVIGFSPW